MSARRQAGVFAALIAGLVLVLLLGLLLLRHLAPAPPIPFPPPPPASVPSVPARPAPPPPAPPLAEGRRELPAVPEGVPPPGADDGTSFVLRGTVRFEDDAPAKGVHFLQMERGEDGEPEVCLEPSDSDRGT